VEAQNLAFDAQLLRRLDLQPEHIEEILTKRARTDEEVAGHA